MYESIMTVLAIVRALNVNIRGFDSIKVIVIEKAFSKMREGSVEESSWT
jgi:hypothetical protein